MTYNLLRKVWLPVRRRFGAREYIRPAAITSGINTDDPIVAFDWNRADFDSASREFMIGLISTTCVDMVLMRKSWQQWWHAPPAPEVLDSAFQPFAHVFNLDGDGPRFMQDLDLRDGSEELVAALLIDNPGENAVKRNTDFFVKRGRIDGLSRGAAAMALCQLQTYAPSGGAGHRTGLRGGGPMTCTVLPDGDDKPSLWHRIWLNAFAERDWCDEATAGRPMFPWLVPTGLSDKGHITTPVDVHPASVFWGMPRRIRLDLMANPDGRPCALTGEIDDVIVDRFAARPYGNNYEAWGLRH